MKKSIYLSSLLGLMLVGANAQATLAPGPVDWIDWTSSTEGTLDIGGTLVGVTMTSDVPVGYIDGDHYFNNANTVATNTYAGLAPEDLIQVNWANSFTLNFDQTLSDLYMALVSVGQPGYAVNYTFEDGFSVISEGSNFWGAGSYGIVGTTFTGREFNGILEFDGSFDSISFTVGPRENWHGFNFGSASLARVPEPAVSVLFGFGLFSLMMLARRRKTV